MFRRRAARASPLVSFVFAQRHSSDVATRRLVLRTALSRGSSRLAPSGSTTGRQHGCGGGWVGDY
ncbi:hypothetical protein BC567DRAFT_223805 [Phyllosticta citribraziliensis]